MEANRRSANLVLGLKMVREGFLEEVTLNVSSEKTKPWVGWGRDRGNIAGRKTSLCKGYKARREDSFREIASSSAWLQRGEEGVGNNGARFQ